MLYIIRSFYASGFPVLAYILPHITPDIRQNITPITHLNGKHGKINNLAINLPLLWIEVG